MGLLNQLPSVEGKKGWPWTEEVDPAVYSGAEWPAITIVTPSYNQGNYLEETIRSVLLQNYPNLQYLIFDGGSTDDSPAIIQKYKSWITHAVSAPDHGQSDAINKGLRMATGRVFNWINSDDYYCKEALKAVAAGFKDPAVSVVCGRSRFFDSTGELEIGLGSDVFGNNLLKTIGWARTDQPCTFYSKAALDRIGFLEESLHYTMDRELWLRYLLEFGLDGIRRIDNIVVNFRLHEQSKTLSFAQHFFHETDALYYSLLQETAEKRFQEITAHTKTGFIKQETALIRNIKGRMDSTTARAIFSYYLLLRGMGYYESGDKAACLKCLSAVEAELLEKEDRKLLQKTRLKASLIPYFLKKRIRRWRTALKSK